MKAFELLALVEEADPNDEVVFDDDGRFRAVHEVIAETGRLIVVLGAGVA